MSSHKDRGLTLAERWLYGRATEEFRKQLSVDPDDAEAHAHLSACLLLDPRNAAEALAEAKLAVALEPNNRVCLYALTTVHRVQKRFREAEQVMLQAIAIRPDADLYSPLGGILYEQQKLPEALQAVDRFVHPQARGTVFAVLGTLHLTAELEGHQLLAVADTEHGDAELKHCGIAARRVVGVHAVWAAGEHDSARCERLEAVDRDREGRCAVRVRGGGRRRRG